jgi:predicted nucleotidyltransferase component of viral defense system
MPRDYLLRHPEFEDLMRIVAGKIGIDPALIEKDGIRHCLYGLQRLGYKFELKGGTSLFKGFKFIRARRRWALI